MNGDIMVLGKEMEVEKGMGMEMEMEIRKEIGGIEL